jgi:hypothetical protein
MMVLTVLDWGVRHNCCFSWEAAGPLGLTPLHLAALLDDCRASTSARPAGQDSIHNSSSSSAGSQGDVAAFVLSGSPGALLPYG